MNIRYWDKWVNDADVTSNYRLLRPTILKYALQVTFNTKYSHFKELLSNEITIYEMFGIIKCT